MKISYIGNSAQNPDNVLDQAKGEYESVLIIGYDKSGALDARASSNITRERILWLIETFKFDVLLFDGEPDV